MAKRAKKPTSIKTKTFTSKKDKVVTPSYETRRPLEGMVVPEGQNLGTELNSSNKAEYEELKDAYVELFKAALAEGLDKREIKKLLNLRSDAFERIEKKLINEDGQVEISKASPYRYYEYLQRQEKCIHDLEYFANKIDNEIAFYEESQKRFLLGEIDKMPGGRANTQAGIMAVKAKSEILDKMIKTGQELGIVEKRAKELRVLGNINLAALPTEELKSLLSKKMREMGNLTKKEQLPGIYNKMLEAQVANNEAKIIDHGEED